MFNVPPHSLAKASSREIMCLVASVCLSICKRSNAWPTTTILCLRVDLARLPRLARLGVCQGRIGQMPKIMFWYHCYLGQCQKAGLRSKVKVKFLEVDIRGSALPSAAKSNNLHYQFKGFVCVSVISGHMWIIMWMRPIAIIFRLLVVAKCAKRSIFLQRLKI